MPWARRNMNPLVGIGSKEAMYEINDYSMGYNSFFSNDKMPFKSGGSAMWRLAQDARITTLGEYASRKGTDFHSQPAGQTEDQAITSVTGAANQTFDQTKWLAQPFTAGTTGRLTRLDVNIRNPGGATGTVMVELWSNVSSAPGVLLARTSVRSADIASSYDYAIARFYEAPELTATTVYWIVVRVQPTGGPVYNWSSTTSATTALTSANGGTTWATTSYALNFKQYYSTTGGVKGLLRAYKSDGTKVTVFAHGTILYTVNNTTGALTEIKTGLNASATHYRFALVNDIVYYVNGFDGYRKWNFTAESQVNATNYTHIAENKGLIFLLEKNDPNKVVYSNFADYETFTSTDFVYIPSPKTGDPVVAILPINGYLLLWTLKNKFILSGSDNATFILDEAPDQKGTYSQETVTSDNNFVYYLSDDGMYRSNGTEPQLLSSDVYEDILKLPNKDTAVVTYNQGRVYLWYTPNGQAVNSKCYVFSLNFGDSGGTTESLDTDSFVGHAFNAFRDNDDLIVASSRVGQVFWQELESNDNTNLGGDIDFILETHYITAGSPAMLKEVRYWNPRFEAQSADYTITAQYATDLRNNWTTYQSPNVQGAGVTYGSGATYGSGVTYGSAAELQAQLYVPGEYRRIAIRYKHKATRQPQTFLGHTFTIQTRRMR